MWAKLIEKIEKNWSERRQPRRRLARAIMALYASMINCQEAYLRHRNSPLSSNRIEWNLALDALISSLLDLESELQIFAPEVNKSLRKHIYAEQFLVFIPEKNSKKFMDELRQL